MFEQILFLVVGVVILVSALMVVTTRNLIHAALWLVATLFGVAVLYGLTDAPFLAMVQVVVYIGAIAILFIFAVMLTQRQLLDKVAQENKNWPTAALIALGTLAGLVLLTAQMPNFNSAKPALFSADPLLDMANALVSPELYLLPFEVASVLLLAALVGSVYLANRK